VDAGDPAARLRHEAAGRREDILAEAKQAAKHLRKLDPFWA
jgi:hypothetical protein